MNPLAAHALFSTLESPLADRGIALLDAFLSPEECAALRTDLLSRRAQFSPARVGAKFHAALAHEIRSDETLWFESGALSPAQKVLWDRLESLQVWLNEQFRLGLVDWEGHYAVYEPGAFYRRHLDRFQSDSRRTLSTVVYLGHPDGLPWRPEFAGELAVFETPRGAPRESSPLTIEPLAGRMVCFRSDTIEHAVLPTQKTRLSVAGWFRTRA